MNLFIDCEFNGFQGELISMALVDEQGNYFYEVLRCAHPTPWVTGHVMTVLNKSPIERSSFQQKLAAFLSSYRVVNIIADWPEDLSHFCNMLISGAGRRLVTPPLSMALCTDVQFQSRIPHNALEDARALAVAYTQKRVPTLLPKPAPGMSVQEYAGGKPGQQYNG